MTSSRKGMQLIVVIMLFLAACPANAALKIGVTLHPYYSYVANIVQDKAEVVPLIPEGFNPHAFEPRSQDIKKIDALDVIILNDIGHDSFARKMIAASENKNVTIIQANKDVPLLSSMGFDQSNRDGIVNPHTFISVSASMIQVNTIAKALSKIDADNAKFYLKNARKYNKKLRKLRRDVFSKLDGKGNTSLKVATVHGAYDYLFREFGLTVSAVIEPGHGIEPSPAQLKKVVNRIKEKQIKVLFTEKDNPSPYTETIATEANISLAKLTHITHGAYTAEAFEEGIMYNLNQIVEAITNSTE